MESIRNRALRIACMLTVYFWFGISCVLKAQTYEKVVSFTDALRTSIPRASSWSQKIESIMVGSDGNVYGTTVLNAGGTIFRMTPNDGTITTLVNLPNADASIQLRTLGAYDQNLYGITPVGGALGYGKLFKVSQGSFVSLVEFTGTAGIRPGRNPDALFQATDGFFYGTTLAGGTNDFGTVYRVTGGGDGFEILANFSGTGGANKGRTPLGIFEASDGNVFGITRAGGAHDHGSIFRIKKTGEYSTLVDFSGSNGPLKGALPISMIQSLNGNFYGSTSSGGTNNHGVLFKLTLQGQFSVIHEFADRTPEFELIQHPSGDIYGVTDKSIFRITTADGFGTVADLGYQVNGPNGSGQFTYHSASSKLVIANDGNLYLSTDPGPNGFSGLDGGNVLQIQPGGIITRCGNFYYYQFSDFLSLAPSNPKNLIALSNGDILGVTTGGIDYRLGFQAGNYPAGHIIRITPPNTGSLGISFFGQTGYPETPVKPQDAVLQGRGQDHNFYGTSLNGGERNLGTVFKLTPTGELTTLHSFAGSDPGSYPLDSGRHPTGDLIEDQNGDLRGLTLAKPADYNYAGPRGFRCSKSGVLNPWGGSLLTLGEYGGDFSSRRGLTTAGNGVDLLGVYPGEFFDNTGLTRTWKIYREGADGTGLDLASLEAAPGSTMLEVNDPAGAYYLGTTLTGGIHGNGTVYKFSPGVMNTNPVPRAASFDDSGGNFNSSVNWLNLPIGPRSSRFSVSFRLTPGAAGMDGVVGLSQGAADWYSDMPCTLRLNSTGQFDAIRGGSFYQAANLLNYVVGQTYEVVMTVDFTSGTYSATVDGTVIADNYAFRAEQAGAAALDTLVIKHESGSYTVAGVSLLKQGRHPLGALIRGSDGNFYGTTSYGGAFNFGTVYRMSPAGVITKLVDFSGNGATNRGSNPIAGLVEYQGALYGTTSAGGAGNLGTAFKMTPAGALETIFHFGVDPEDSVPMGRLIVGFDGNLYGTTSGSNGGAGSVYRLVFDGVPAIYPFASPPKSLDSATVKAKINPRGGATNATVEYGTDGQNFTSLPLAANLTGKRSLEYECSLPNLIRGETYYYRFRASNATGETVSPTQSFLTYPLPDVSILPATLISPTSAKFNGNVHPRGELTTVSFEWGTDGNSFPNTLLALPATITGDMIVPVSTPVAGLIKGTSYYYRIVATSEGGTIVSGTQSFTTLTEPTATIAAPTDVTSHSVVLNGSVNALGASAAVIFEYGTDGLTFPFSVGATPATVPGDTRHVSAILSNLTQGATYYYRIKANSAGGDGFSSVGSFSLKILSGFERVFPSAPLAAQGTVLVNLTPSAVGGWRFTGEQLWRPSGIPAGALTTGDRNIEFRPVAGYIQPPPETVSVVSGGATALVDRVYYETLASGSGGLSVTLKPLSLAAASVPQAERAQWRLVGDDDTQWRDSDTALTGLLPGTYLVECKAVPSAAGRATPPISSVQVRDFQTTFPTLTYFLADAQTGAPPVPVPFESVATDSPSNAYAYVGQIRSNLGSSSGFVVKQRVVATAGHVVFDDGKLAGVTGLQWLFQRQSGIYEPKPQEPRGFYLFNGYSAARREPGVVPGEGTTTSKNLDVAALYFVANATTNEPNFPGRGGFGGFLASDATVNEFLTSPAPKILVGYPVDGVSGSNQGLIHATAPLVGSPPQAVGFAQTFDRTYVTPDIRGSGGMSGGPLCVLAQNGNYYPAAVYLGGTGQTIVRSIDSAVIDMFNRAQESGDDDSNNTGGGITLTSVSPTGTDTEPGAIKVTILPATAASAGRWGLKPEASDRISGGTSSGRAAGEYILRFTTISGFQAPTSPTIRINGGALTEYTFTYAGLPPTITSAGSATGRRGQSLTYQIVADQSPTSYSVSGNLPNGLTLNTDTGRISGTLQQVGVFTITLRATNAGGTGTKSLSLICRPAVSNQSATATLGQPTSRQIISSESGADVSYSADDLPPGTSLNEETGLITGIPTQAGVFPSLVTVTKDGASASAILTFTVTATPVELWRMANFQTTSNTGNASNTADPDKDGQTNLSEYAAGTNPNNAGDVFRILTTTKSATAFTVTAAGKASRSYVLERRATLSSGLWTTVTSIGPLADDGPSELSDPSPPAGAAFYRLRVSAP